MADLLAYVAKEQASFREKPLCEVDSMVLSQLAMISASGCVPPYLKSPGALKRGGMLLHSMISGAPKGTSLVELQQACASGEPFLGFNTVKTKELLRLAAVSPRFGRLVLHDYCSVFSEREETQFAAIAFTCPRRFSYVAFRGTDRTVVGWKEDFNMAAQAPVPAQALALSYAEGVAGRTRTPLVLGGHSKGGNLAVYAAAKASPRVAARITAVYDHDGPGFPEGVFTPEERTRVQALARKTVPEESLVGLLMESVEPVKVVESDDHGLGQHSLFNWRLAGGELVEACQLAPSARFIADVLNQWVSEMTLDQRREAVDALFEAIKASGTTDAADLLTDGKKALGALVGAALNTPPESRAVIVSHMRSLAAIAAKRALMGQ